MILEKETLEKLGKSFEIASKKAKIICKCDYCGNTFERLKHNILRSWSHIKSDSCSNETCIQQKRIKTNKLLFNVENAFQSEVIKAKIAQKHNSKQKKLKYNYDGIQELIQDWLNSFGFNFMPDKEFEVDMYDSSKKLAIEYCGLHSHNEFSPEPRMTFYHRNKYKKCLKQDVQLLTIFSDEWEKRELQCKGHIKSILGVNDARLYARKCIVEEISKETGRQFFNDYHIQGKNRLGVVFFGLFHNSELCGVMSLGRHNRQVSALVLDRLCFKHGFQITGGASKLFSRCVAWAKEQGHNEIISFSDNRWSLGKVYTALNFKMVNDYRPDYSYVNIKSPNERLSKQSQKKGIVNCPEGMTEYDWAHARGLARIWDCGKKRWVYYI